MRIWNSTFRPTPWGKSGCRNFRFARAENHDRRSQLSGGVPAGACGQSCSGSRAAGVQGFNTEIVGKDGFTMPATQHDAVLWLSGSAYDVVFDVAHAAIAAVKDLASVAEETSSWAYRHDRDLTGFIDGSENPSLIDASEAVLIPEGNPGEGGTILLLQKWKHDTAAWESFPSISKSKLWGGEKLDSIELDDKPTSRTSRARIRISTARSSVGTCHTEPLRITEPCSLDSVPISGGFPKCWRAWLGFVPVCATRLRATRGRSRVRTISFRQPRACANGARQI